MAVRPSWLVPTLNVAHILLLSLIAWKARVDKIKPPYDKTNRMTCAPGEDSDQLGHLPSLIRVFAVHSMGG